MTLPSFDPELHDYLTLADRMADAARKETLPRFRNGVQIFNKAGIWFDPVTDADREAERAMRRMIRLVYPRHGILGEEFGEEHGDDFDKTGAKPDWRWVLDPVDGTRAFVCGTPSWMTLIALEHRGEPVAGLLDQPFTDERWVGTKKGATYCHQGETVTCKTSGLTDISRARITTTDPRNLEGYFSNDEARAFEALARNTRLARFSLDAYGYALLAIGEIDIVAETSLARHDYAALVPIVEGAGGVITNWSGAPLGSDASGEVLASATQELHEQALTILQENRSA